MNPTQTFKMKTPLDEDLAALEKFAEDPRQDEIQRGKARKAAAEIRVLVTRASYLLHCAKMMKLDSWCRALSDADLAGWVADSGTGRRSVLYSILGAFAACSLQECNASSELHVWSRTQQLYEIFCIALTEEVGSRQLQNENVEGRLVRRLLVEEDARGDLLSGLGKWITGWLWLPGDQKEGRRDAVSVVTAKIWEDIREFTTLTPIAANPAALTAFIAGKFNRVPGRARDHLRTEIETACRRGIGELSQLGDHEAHTQVQLVEQLPAPNNFSEESDRKLLVEQLLTRAGLSDLEGAVIELHYFEGKTQGETAASLKVSQGRVSKVLSELIQKMQALHFQRGTSAPAPE